MNNNSRTNNDMSISGSVQNPYRGTCDSFDISIEANENRGRNFFNNGSKKSSSPHQNQQNDLKPFIGITSPGDSNVPTQGDALSPKEENYQRNSHGFGRPPPQFQNQSRNPRQPRDRPEVEAEIFSFRREGQKNESQRRNQENRENHRATHREDFEFMDYPNSYEKTRLWLIKLKKIYVFFLLNIFCLGLIIFNFFVAYSTEKIIFPKIEQINNQFQRKVILDIDLMNPFETCNEAYIPASMGIWPGYNEICACSSSLSYLGECSPENSGANCLNTGKLEPLPVESWDGKKICLKKSEKTLLQYFENSNFVESYNGNFMCPNGLKKCTLSSNKNFICVGRFEFCPITQIEVDENKDSDKNKIKAKVLFANKALIYDNQGTTETTFTDFIINHQYCEIDDPILGSLIDKKFCYQGSKILLDSINEYKVIEGNIKNNKSSYSSLEGRNISMGLFAVPTENIDLCIFNNTFNPVILNAQLANWNGVKYILFMNPYFISTLFVINVIRLFMIKYINKEANGRLPLKRKKEIYNLLGKSLTGSSLIVVTEVCIILYYIFWGYLLLNPDKIIAEKWEQMSCLPFEVKTEIQYMIEQFTRIETFNMIIIGPMILGCIMEALFSQYKITTTPYDQIVEEREEQ